MTKITMTLLQKEFFTTFEVGEICQVYHTTVINWINKGQLKAYTTPGKHRRIQKNDLVVFMEKFNIRIPAEFRHQKKILIVDDDKTNLKLLEKSFQRFLPSTSVQTTTSGFEALVSVGKDVPDLIVLDVVMPGLDGIEVCKS